MSADVSDRARLFLDNFAAAKELIDELVVENERLRRRVADVEQESRDFVTRYLEVEQQNNNLANLYVVGHQLHSTLDFREVLQILREVVINFIGSECFAILLMDEQARVLRTILAEGGDVLPEIERLNVRVGEGKLGLAAASGETDFLQGDAYDSAPELDRPLAVVPLRIKDRTIGLLVIYRLLEQKRTFSQTDFELFSLLAGQAATAVFSAKLYSDAERKLNTIQEFLDLLTNS